jgi:hypothetical protein
VSDNGDWRALYYDAVVELDPIKLLDKIEAAQKAIDDRLKNAIGQIGRAIARPNWSLSFFNLRVNAALRPAAMRILVSAAFLPAVLRLRVMAAFFAAAKRSVGIQSSVKRRKLSGINIGH